MTDSNYTKFEATVVVEGPHASITQAHTPAALLQLALQHALFNMPADAVAELVQNTTGRMLHSLSCKRRKAGDLVRLEDNDPDGYSGIYEILVGRGEPTDCASCGNPLCYEWPTLFDTESEGSQIGDFAYHISECQMLDLLR